ncbi:MAG: L-ribulose-5-phosphate 4-epimerase AraD, partial [bacterium]
MDYRELREEVVEANRRIVEAGLVLLTWGNASVIDRAREVVGIKPSGVDYDALTAETVPIVRLSDSVVLDGAYRQSSDTATHLELYRRFPSVGAIVHTHSHYAVCYAQARLPIPCLGTTHADHFLTEVPITRELTVEEIAGDYEHNTGRVIVELFGKQGDGNAYTPEQTPAVLVTQHGPFAWGPDAEKAVENAIVLEEVARMGLHTTA